MVDKVGKWGETFPLLDQTWWNENEKRERKSKAKKSVGGKSDRGEKMKKGEERKRKIFLAFRRSKIEGPKIKVGPRNENYV